MKQNKQKFTKEGFHSFLVAMIVFFTLQGITMFNPFYMLAGIITIRMFYLEYKNRGDDRE